VLVRLGGFLLVAMLAVWLYALLDAITADRQRVRILPKGAWIAVVLLTFEVGAVLWFGFGRPVGRPGTRGADRRRAGEAGVPRTRGRSSGTTAETGRSVLPGLPGRPPRLEPLAPDDDPEFLANLARRTGRERTQRLDRWEAELRRREEELRRREDSTAAAGGDEPADPDGGSGGPADPTTGPGGVGEAGPQDRPDAPNG